MGGSLQTFEGGINGTTRAIGQTSSVFTLLAGGLSMQFMGLAMKFFQTIDNIGNYELINIPYGKMMKTVFDLIESVNKPPEFSSDIWLNHQKGLLSLQYFPNSRNKISKKFKEGFIERTSANFILYLVKNIFYIIT